MTHLRFIGPGVRSALALFMGLVANPIVAGALIGVSSFDRVLSEPVNARRSLSYTLFVLVDVLVLVAPSCVAAVIFYMVLTSAWGQRPGEAGTRCRRCGYILRGMTEPRRPECGNRI